MNLIKRNIILIFIKDPALYTLFEIDFLDDFNIIYFLFSIAHV